MDDAERAIRMGIADQIMREVAPMLDEPYHFLDDPVTGYDCHGCGTTGLVMDHCVRIALAGVPVNSGEG